MTEEGPGRDPPRALGFLKRFGWNSTSFQSLEPGFRHWFDPADRGCVAYFDTGSAYVAAGAPIAAEADLAAMAAAFERRARAAGRRVSYFGTERRFLAATGHHSIRIGQQPVWDPRDWAAKVDRHAGLRAQLRRAANKGVRVRAVEPAEIIGAEGSPRADLEQLITEWQASRRLPPMSFLVQVYPFSFLEERRVFAAERDGALVAFAAMVPVYARSGWLIEDLIRGPSAPNGTAESLVAAAMAAAAAAGSQYLTLGLAPLAGHVSAWLRAARTLGRPLYDFRGLHAFKAKLRPDGWEPITIALPPGQSAALTLVDALRAFAADGLLRFAARAVGASFRRRPA